MVIVMNLDQLTIRMANNAQTIRHLTIEVAEDQARWRPDPDSWSILEVINHLCDEEREDFRVRLDIILHRPEQAWPGINPEGWVSERQYNRRDLEPSVTEFLRAREESLIWLKGLSDVDWQATYDAPFGRITAGDMFASWVAHDLLHLRQLVELHWAHTLQQVQPHQVDYAGTW
jgi:hypothetical protein